MYAASGVQKRNELLFSVKWFETLDDTRLSSRGHRKLPRIRQRLRLVREALQEPTIIVLISLWEVPTNNSIKREWADKATRGRTPAPGASDESQSWRQLRRSLIKRRAEKTERSPGRKGTVIAARPTRKTLLSCICFCREASFEQLPLSYSGDFIWSETRKRNKVKRAHPGKLSVRCGGGDICRRTLLTRRDCVGDILQLVGAHSPSRIRRYLVIWKGTTMSPPG